MAKTLRLRNRDGWATKPLADIPANRLTPTEVDDNFLGVIDDYADQTDPLKGAGMVGRAVAALQDYTALRGLTSACQSKTVYITGLLVTPNAKGIAGTFLLNVADTTTPDNGGTVIVDASGRRWYRDFNAALGAQVTWFGATGDGVADDSDALQLAADYIRDNQWPVNGSQWTYKVCTLLYPEGTYKITRQIEVRAAIVMKGVGNGYVAGSTIRQTAPDTNIFTMISSGSDISGLNFEFESQAGSGFGYALYYPAFDPVTPFGAISSNSHYIRNNRFGGTYRYGRFIKIEGSNDVEISHNIIDVIMPGQCITIGSQASIAPTPSDIRIIDNNFFAINEGIVVYKAKSVLIANNCFSNQYATGSSIKLVTDIAVPVVWSITGVNITGNTFWRQYNCLTFDGSASNVNYNNNVHTECLAEPIVAVGSLDYYRFKFHNNDFSLSVAGVDPYPYTYSYNHCPFAFDSKRMFDSEICDTTVDANGINTVTKLTASPSLTYVFGSGMVLRNNKIINNTSVLGAYKTHVPMSAKELVINSKQTFVNYPVAQPVFNLNTTGIAVDDYATFCIDYVVRVDKSGSIVTAKTGTVKASVVNLSGTPKWTFTELSSASDDTGGGGAPPGVAFAGVTSGSGAFILITVSGGVTATFSTLVDLTAYEFKSYGDVQVQTT